VPDDKEPEVIALPRLHVWPVLPLAVALVVGLAEPSPADAFELTDCNLTLQSIDREDQPIDAATGNPAGGEGGTYEDPFRVDYDGTVRYEADTGGQVITDVSWHVDVFFIPTPARGSGANEGQETSADGEILVNRTIPFRTSGLFFLSGELTGDGGACRGGLWVRIGGKAADPAPPTTIPFWIALIIILAGLVVLWTARPSRLVATQIREVR
jgi:hypothetical protein